MECIHNYQWFDPRSLKSIERKGAWYGNGYPASYFDWLGMTSFISVRLPADCPVPSAKFDRFILNKVPVSKVPRTSDDKLYSRLGWWLDLWQRPEHVQLQAFSERQVALPCYKIRWWEHIVMFYLNFIIWIDAIVYFC